MTLKKKLKDTLGITAEKIFRLDKLSFTDLDVGSFIVNKT